MTDFITTDAPEGARADLPPAPEGRAPGDWGLRHTLAALMIAVLAVLFFLPGIDRVPPLDRDEPRFAQATKQMVETGNYLDIRFQNEARHKKPIGIYWIQSAAVALSGEGAEAPLWVYRAPSFLAAVASVLAAIWIARAFLSPAGSLLVGVLMASTVLLGVEARLAKTDAVLLATILLSMGVLARVWRRRPRIGVLPEEIGRESRVLPVLFWAALAAGTLVKGPVAPMILALTAAALVIVGRELRWLGALKPVRGLILFVILVAPWFVAIGIATKGAFFTEAIGNDLLGKVAEGKENHGAPPLTHLALMLATTWPLAPFAVLAVPAVWRLRRVPAVVFALCWLLPSWLVFELVPTKLPHYVLPLVPAIALAVVAVFVDEAAVPGRILRRVAAVHLGLLPVALAAAAVILPWSLGDIPSFLGVPVVVAGAIIGVVAAGMLWRGTGAGVVRPMLVGVLSALVISAGTWLWVMPGLRMIWMSPRLVAAVEAARPCPGGGFASVGFTEPSLVFLAGTGTRLASAEEAAALLAHDACAVVAIESRQAEAFAAATAGFPVPIAEVGREQGFNINGGRRLDIGLYRRAAP